MLLCALIVLLPLSSCGDKESVVAVTLSSFSPSTVLRGENITIKGTGLSRVTKVVFPENVEVSSFVSHTDAEIVVTVPQEVASGRVKLVYPGGEATSRQRITFYEPVSVESVSPTDELVAGDVITVHGDYLYNIIAATFAGDVVVRSRDFVSVSRKELKIVVPDGAKNGKISFRDNAEIPAIIEYEIPLLMAEVAYLSMDKRNVDSGDQIVITGRHLEMVEQVVYPGETKDQSFRVSPDGTRITTTVPTDTYSGAIKLVTRSREMLMTDEIQYQSIVCTGVEPRIDVAVGAEIKIKGELLNKVQQVEFPDGILLNKGEFSANHSGTELVCLVPKGAVGGRIKLSQNAFITIETPVITIAENDDGKEQTVIWEGEVSFDGSWGHSVKVKAENFVRLTEKSRIYFYYEQDAASNYWQLKPMDGEWKALSYNLKVDPMWECITLNRYTSQFAMPLMQDDVKRLKTTGMVVSGCWLKLVRITVEF